MPDMVLQTPVGWERLRRFIAKPRAEGSALRNVVLVAVHDNARQAAGTMLQQHSRPVVRGTT